MQITNENTTFGFAMAAGKLRGVRKFPLPVYICFPQQTTCTIADICPRLRLGFSGDGIRKNWLGYYSAPVWVTEYCDERVCLPLYVCLFVRERSFGNINILCMLWPWVHYPLTALQYGMFFRFTENVIFVYNLPCAT